LAKDSRLVIRSVDGDIRGPTGDEKAGSECREAGAALATLQTKETESSQVRHRTPTDSKQGNPHEPELQKYGRHILADRVLKAKESGQDLGTDESG
jgi:hypothetical protein